MILDILCGTKGVNNRVEPWPPEASLAPFLWSTFEHFASWKPFEFFYLSTSTHQNANQIEFWCRHFHLWLCLCWLLRSLTSVSICVYYVPSNSQNVDKIQWQIFLTNDSANLPKVKVILGGNWGKNNNSWILKREKTKTRWVRFYGYDGLTTFDPSKFNPPMKHGYVDTWFF